MPDRLLPWAQVDHVSTRRDHRIIRDIVVNDAGGTTVMVDVFLELRVTDPVKAKFSVADWERALTNVVTHDVISILGTMDLKDIVADRTELHGQLERDIAEETARWGVRIERVLLHDVRLLPELSEQMLRSVAAKLERWKADVDEEGRQRVAMIEAETTAEVASLLAEARRNIPWRWGAPMPLCGERPIFAPRSTNCTNCPCCTRNAPCLRRLRRRRAARGGRGHAGDRGRRPSATLNPPS